MSHSWLDSVLEGSVEEPIKDRDYIRDYQASMARHVIVSVYHSNVLHWLEIAETYLGILRSQDVFPRDKTLKNIGQKTLSLEQWFSDRNYHYAPISVWSQVKELERSLKEALEATPNHLSYYRTHTAGLLSDVNVIEEALHRAAEKYGQQNQHLRHNER